MRMREVLQEDTRYEFEKTFSDYFYKVTTVGLFEKFTDGRVYFTFNTIMKPG